MPDRPSGLMPDKPAGLMPGGPAGLVPAGVDEGALRQALIATARAMNASGINQGSAGNLAVRCRDQDGRDGLLITPSAMPYDRLEPDDIVWVALDDGTDGTDGVGAPGAGETAPLQRGRRRASSEWRMHRDLLQTRRDVGAVLHAHPVFATTLACLRRVQDEGVPAFHYMIAMAGGDSLRCAPYATYGTAALSAHALAAMSGRRACLLAHHGLLVAAGALDEALALAIEVEALCRMYWQVLQVEPDPPCLSAGEMRQVLLQFDDYKQWDVPAGPGQGPARG